MSKHPRKSSKNARAGRQRRAMIKLFVAHSMSNENGDSIYKFKELAKSEGFDPVMADGPASTTTLSLVSKKMDECRGFAALIQISHHGKSCGMWIPAEIGMAIERNMPMVAFCENSLKESATSLLRPRLIPLFFERGNLFKVEKEIRNTLRKFRLELLSGVDTTKVSKRKKTPHNGFESRIESEWDAKVAIAKHVLETYFRKGRLPQNHEVFVDSGTTTFQVLQQTAFTQNLKVRIRTNNIPGLNELSQIEDYPIYAVPGKGSSKYHALLGDETVTYLKRLFTTPEEDCGICLSIVAVTAIDAEAGISGNDRRHNEIKRVLLTNCPHCVVVCDATKLMETKGHCIFGDNEGWRDFVAELKKSGRRLDFVTTHLPSSGITGEQRERYLSTLRMLRETFGTNRVKVV